MDRLAAVSVDLDTLSHYRAIHALGGADGAATTDADAIYDKCLPRFLELFAHAGVRATFFVIGADVRRPGAAGALRAAARAGHEIANHSLRHRYDLSRLDDVDVRAEVEGGHVAIAETVGAEHAPRGFRAPGYNLSPAILAAVEAQGYRWDSSIFPCPPYYLAKWAVMASIAARGGRSGAVPGDPRQLWAPAAPYVPRREAPWRRAGNAPSYGVLEIPIATLAGTRAPYIGTFLVLAGRRGAAWMTAWAARAPLVNLELHGIDLCDAAEDAAEPDLVARQPDLRVPLGQKRAVLEDTFERLARTHRFVTLSEVSAAYGALAYSLARNRAE